MAGTMLAPYNDIENDQPWDQLWEYVLGDEFDDDLSRERTSSFRRYRSDDTWNDADESFVEDPILLMQSDKPEAKRRLSFNRSSSFNRQTSNQSNATTGSNSSFRFRGFLNRGRRNEEQDPNSETASFLPTLSTVLSGGDDDSTVDNNASSGKLKRRNSWKKYEPKTAASSKNEVIETCGWHWKRRGRMSGLRSPDCRWFNMTCRTKHSFCPMEQKST